MRRKFELTPAIEWLENEGIALQQKHLHKHTANFIRRLFDILDDHPIADCCQDYNDYPGFRFHDDNPVYLGWEHQEIIEWRNSLTVRISSEET